MIVLLVLQGKYVPGKQPTHLTSKRTVSIDLDKPEELVDLVKFDCDGSGNMVWGLGNERDGWWKVVEAFEIVWPTEALHEHKYPVSFLMTDGDIDDAVSEARAKVEPAFSMPGDGDGGSQVPDAYFIVAEEWNYPTESGRDPSQVTYDNPDEALDACEAMAKAEMANFADVTKLDCLPPARCDNGFILTTRMGLDPFYYLARVIPVMSRMQRVLNEVNDNVRKARAI